ncbi:hypothetical protein AB0I50_17605, partial [Streptomyces prunicolor]
MSSPTGPASGLPVRMPRPRQPGRHRRPEQLANQLRGRSGRQGDPGESRF